MLRAIVTATVRRRCRAPGGSVAACIPVCEFDDAGAWGEVLPTDGQRGFRSSTALPSRSADSRDILSIPSVSSVSSVSSVTTSATAAKGEKKQEHVRELSDWATVKEMLSYVKPSDNRDTALRLSAAFGLLIASKGLNVQVPFIFKHVVDTLSVDPTGLTPATIGTVVALTPPMLVVGYGVSRIGASLCNEMRNAVFAKVTQNAIRTVANRVFRHLHQLDLSFHLDRQTGAVSRIIDRGTRGINFIMSSMVFNVVPTALEVSMVSGCVSWSVLVFLGHHVRCRQLTNVFARCQDIGIQVWDAVCAPDGRDDRVLHGLYVLGDAVACPVSQGDEQGRVAGERGGGTSRILFFVSIFFINRLNPLHCSRALVGCLLPGGLHDQL